MNDDLKNAIPSIIIISIIIFSIFVIVSSNIEKFKLSCKEKNGVIVEINGNMQCVKNDFKLIEVKK